MQLRAAAICMALALAACGSGSSDADKEQPSPGTSDTATRAATSFESGIYYKEPGGDFRLARLDEKRLTSVSIPSAGFDLNSEFVVHTDRSSVFRVTADGDETEVEVDGLFHLARPSLSPDEKRVVVQANESGSEPPENLNIYVIDLDTGDFQQVSSDPENEESPEWVSENVIAYVSFVPRRGIYTHLYDVATRQELLVIQDGAIHITISADGTTLFVPIKGRFYDVKTGAMTGDIKGALDQGLRDLGYTTDDRFPGQANLGTFPMDADFSPDGSKLIIDGAVQKDGKYGVAMFEVDRDGRNMRLISPLLDADPEFANNHSFSQLNPLWLP